MKIRTLTLNPAFDIHCEVENLQLHRENYVTSAVKHAGGKGINISRALTNFGVENQAYCVVGSSGGDEFIKMLHQDGIACKVIKAEGKIRENITLHSGGKETRISFEGSPVNAQLLAELSAICQEEERAVVTFTGRLPQGIDHREALNFLTKVKTGGANLVVDCNSFTMVELLELKPWLIKPNAQELSQLLGHEMQTEQEVQKAAESMHRGGITHVIVSLGGDGFVYWGEVGGIRVSVPKITPVSTIGAGDSLIAGFLAGIYERRGIEDMLRLAAAFGTAACLTEGTNPPNKEEIYGLEPQIRVQSI